MNITEKNIEKILIENVPEFLTVYKEYEKDNENESLPHVLFGSYLIPFTENSIKSNNEITLKKIGSFLDACFKFGNKYVDNLIHVSFFENMERKTFEKIPISDKFRKHLKELDKKGYFN